MVTNVTSLTGNGLKDWLIQRLTAVYFGFYLLFLFIYVLMHPGLTYELWLSLFSMPLFQIASILALFSFLLHAWIGLWTVTTDYISCTVLRLAIQSIVLLLLLAEFIWGLLVIWG